MSSRPTTAVARKQVEVTFPIGGMASMDEVFAYSNDLEEVALSYGASCVAAGVGFGERDMTFWADAGVASDLARKLRMVAPDGHAVVVSDIDEEVSR